MSSFQIYLLSVIFKDAFPLPCFFLFFFLMIRRPRRSPLFPYTPLSRSVTGGAPGTATITAMSEGRTGSATVTVALVPVASVVVTPAPATVPVLGPWPAPESPRRMRSEEHTSELQSHLNIVCRLLLEKKK